MFWFRNLVIAIMTDSFVALDMMSQRYGTVGTIFNVPARWTLDASRKTAPIKQQNYLAVALNRGADFLTKFLADRSKSFPSGKVDAQIDRGNIGQWQIEHAFRKAQFLILPG